MVNYYLDLDELAQSAVKALQACSLHFAQFAQNFQDWKVPKNKQLGYGCKIGQETSNAVKQMAQKIVI